MPAKPPIPIIPESFAPARYEGEASRGPLTLKDGDLFFHGTPLSGMFRPAQQKVLAALILSSGGVNTVTLGREHKRTTGTEYPHPPQVVTNNLKVHISHIKAALAKAFPDLPKLKIGSFNPVYTNGEWGSAIKDEDKGYFLDTGERRPSAKRRKKRRLQDITPVIPDYFGVSLAGKHQQRGDFTLEEDGKILYHGRDTSQHLTPGEKKYLTALIAMEHGVSFHSLKRAHEESTGTEYPHDPFMVKQYLARTLERVTKRLNTAFPDLPTPSIETLGPQRDKDEHWPQIPKEYQGYILLPDNTSATQPGPYPQSNARPSGRTNPEKPAILPDCFDQFEKAAAQRGQFTLTEDSKLLYYGNDITETLTLTEQSVLKGLILSEHGLTPTTIRDTFERSAGTQYTFRDDQIMGNLKRHVSGIRGKLKNAFPDLPAPDIRPYGPNHSIGERGPMIPQIHQGYFLPGDTAPAPKT